MKTITPLALAAAILCSAAPAVLGQDIKTIPSIRQITVEFKGGTLAEFLDLIRTQNNWVNVVASPAAKHVELPALSIKNANVLHLLKAVAAIVTTDCNVSVSFQGSPGTEPVHSLRVTLKPLRSSRSKRGSSIRSQVFSLRYLTRGRGTGDTLKTQTILMAIDTGLAVEGVGSRAKIKYHRDSGLLFVRGTSEQLRLVTSVLDELRRDVQLSRSSRRGGTRRKADAPKKNG